MTEAWIIDACRTPRGIGKKGKGSLAEQHPQHLGATVLKAIAERTEGRYFHATSRQKLEAIYAEIGELETTEISSEIHVAYAERFAFLLWTGLGLLLGEFLLANGPFRRMP